MSQNNPQYRPGDVANGHRLNENGTWEPLPAQPAKQKKPIYKRWWVITLAVLFVLGAIGSIGGGGDKTPASNNTVAAPSTSTTTSASDETPVADNTPAASTTTTKAAAPTTKAAPAKPKLTSSQEQAIGAAKDYLSFQAFSRKGLIQQLSSSAGSGFSVKDATFAVDYLHVNWNEQAAKAAKSYLEMMHFSRNGLIQQLESSAGSGFTHSQAVYGVKKAGL